LIFVVQFGTMGGGDLVIDQEVRNWVLIPLTICVMLLMLLRQYLSVVSNRCSEPRLLHATALQAPHLIAKPTASSARR
jgi:hypothetical protein